MDIKSVTKQLPSVELPKLLSATRALRSVTSSSGKGVYASSDRLFKGAIFGRDSLEVAEDLMYIRPRLARQILLTIASLQGEVKREDNEEEPGKIIHEYRTPFVDGEPLNSFSKQIYDRLCQRWGGDEHELAYYGSVDSTPLFIRVLSCYCQVYGQDILSKEIYLRSGRQSSVLEVADNACQWLTSKLKQSHSGLLEFMRMNPHGIENQAWKDSAEFYVHTDGSLANHSQPIASVEVQALAYDALILAADLFSSRRLDKQAKRLQKTTLKKLWLPDLNYFALGLDYDQRGRERVIKTLTANPAEILDSYFFDSLPRGENQKYIGGLIQRIFSEDFLTDAGVRSRALSEAHLVSHWDYHGSFTSWPKETYDIAKGLRRQGLDKLSQELENRVINSLKAARSYPEFFYVDKRGRVLGTALATSTHGELVIVDSANQPERTQAWTVSAAMGCLKAKATVRAKVAPWQRALEKDILKHLPHMPRLISIRELAERYPFYPYELHKEVIS